MNKDQAIAEKKAKMKELAESFSRLDESQPTTTKGEPTMNEIITTAHEYFDDVYYIWRKVPSYWVGDYVSSHSHKVRLFYK